MDVVRDVAAGLAGAFCGLVGGWLFLTVLLAELALLSPGTTPQEFAPNLAPTWWVDLTVVSIEVLIVGSCLWIATRLFRAGRRSVAFFFLVSGTAMLAPITACDASMLWPR